MPQGNIQVNTNYSCHAFAYRPRYANDGDMNRVKSLRKRANLSQVELAEKVGCSQGMISKIEAGTANPTLDLIEALAVALDTTPASLFGVPALQQRVIDAIMSIDPELRESALVVLENMRKK